MNRLTLRISEKQLVRRLQQRDDRAAEEFIDAFGGRIHALARRHTRSEADAEDLTQEIFVDLCRAIHGFRGESSLSTWVYRVALNHCLKHRERSGARPEPLPLDDERNAQEAGGASDPLRRAAHSELAGRIDTALADLSQEHREVVLLHEMQGLTYTECAAILGVPIGTVKSRLFNAFRRLRTLLGTYVRELESGPPEPAAAGMATASASAAGAATAAVTPLPFAERKGETR